MTLCKSCRQTMTSNRDGFCSFCRPHSGQGLVLVDKRTLASDSRRLQLTLDEAITTTERRNE